MPLPFRVIFADNFKMKFPSEGLVAHEPRPAGDGLTNRAWARAMAARRRARIAQQIEEAFGHLALLARRERDDAFKQSQRAPEGSHPGQEHDEAHAQHIHTEILAGAQPPIHEHGLGDDEGGDFLLGGQRGITVEEGGMAHLDFQFLERDFLFPALGVEPQQFDGRVLAVFQQTGPEAHDRAVLTPSTDDAANFTNQEIEFLAVVVSALDFDEHTTIGEFLDEAGSEGGFDADEEVALVLNEASEQGRQETSVAVKPICQQKAEGRDVADELVGEGDFRDVVLAHGQRQGVMESEFHQQTGANLGEGGGAATGTGFGELSADGRGVEHGEERAIDADQQETFVESMGMVAQRGAHAQDGVEDRLKDAPAQALTASGNGGTGKFDAGELATMGAVGSLGLQSVEDQHGDEEEGADFGLAAFARAELAQDAAELARAETLCELFEENARTAQAVRGFFNGFWGDAAVGPDLLPGWLGRTGFLLHPDLKTNSLTFRKSKMIFFSTSCQNPIFPLKNALKSSANSHLHCG